MKAKLISALAAVILAGACDGQGGNISAEGKSEENSFSIKAPGVDIKLDLPEGARENMNVESDNDLIYPGSRLGGVHIEGGRGGGAVELRFSTADAPEKVFAWYRDPARADFTIENAAKQANGFVLSGRPKDKGDPFKIRLVPGRGGGTDGTLSVTDTN